MMAVQNSSTVGCATSTKIMNGKKALKTQNGKINGTVEPAIRKNGLCKVPPHQCKQCQIFRLRLCHRLKHVNFLHLVIVDYVAHFSELLSTSVR